MNEKKETKVDGSINVNFEKDYYFGVLVKQDRNQGKEKDTWVETVDAKVQVAGNFDGGKGWAAWTWKDNVAKAGCINFYKEKNFTHAYELKYYLGELKDNKKGIAGLNVEGVAGGKYVLSDSSTLSYSVEAGQSVAANGKFEHKLDKNWKVAVTQQFHASRIADGKRPPYDLGFDVAYTL